ncbi:MAG: hypothetical protein SCARUB_02242 [Candidatus Scalindua rubra]|uniref:Uncharacterized protein n=1 Tax=Candidatus Scalindua rubra TaxID=1872076 RepID=A0A1E3XAI3_9BACT|nr:MAG: hypothetical protein SCARUB_02242 [Candidatus Scalindua rubra]
MNNSIETFYSDLRKLKEGKLAIFLGAGSSYDYGIPTMEEMASMLVNELKKPEKKSFFDSDTINVLSAISGFSEAQKGSGNKSSAKELDWNVEDLLTRLHNILDAVGDKKTPFPAVTTTIGSVNFSKEQIQAAESKLIEFMVKCYQLDVTEKTSHGDGSIEYLANYFEFLGEFHNSIYIFTTNNDLCIEAAIMRLSQKQKSSKKKEFYLIDGFSHGILPTFSISNFSLDLPKSPNRVIVYLWKLHGSIDWRFTNPIQNSDTNKSDEKFEFSDESIICRYFKADCWGEFQKAGAISKNSSIDKSKIMIFPTPSKYSQTYSNPYMDLYQSFRRILETAELLLVVGTSFPDGHINSAIKSFVGRDNTLVYIADPMLKDEEVNNILGKCEAIQPVIQVGFKDLINNLYEIELAHEENVSEENNKNESMNNE